MIKSTEVRLKSRPIGYPTLDNFEIACVELPEIKEGEILGKKFIYVCRSLYERQNE